MANEMQKMSEAVNVRKFRKIAKNIRRLIDHIRKEKALSENLAREAFDQIDDLAKEALIAPPRNCDMGTANEHVRRFRLFCQAHQSPMSGMCDPICPLCGNPDKSHCITEWMLLPYSEGGAK